MATSCMRKCVSVMLDIVFGTFVSELSLPHGHFVPKFTVLNWEAILVLFFQMLLSIPTSNVFFWYCYFLSLSFVENNPILSKNV